MLDRRKTSAGASPRLKARLRAWLAFLALLAQDEAGGWFVSAPAAPPGASAGWFGPTTGSSTPVDGAAVTLDGVVTPAWTTRVGSVYTVTREYFVGTLTVNAGITLNHSGFWGNGTSLVNRGHINADGGSGLAGAGGSLAGNGELCSQTGTGGSGGNNAAGTAGTTSTGVGILLPGGVGAGGAGGASGGGNAGGAGGTYNAPTTTNFGLGNRLAIALLAAMNMSAQVPVRFNNGAGGGGGGASGVGSIGGGGGAVGGIMGLAFATIDNTGTGSITANGGAGANGNGGGTGAGGGGGGAGGVLFVVAKSLTGNAPTANGGAAGAGTGTGAAGVAGPAGLLQLYIG